MVADDSKGLPRCHELGVRVRQDALCRSCDSVAYGGPRLSLHESANHPLLRSKHSTDTLLLQERPDLQRFGFALHPAAPAGTVHAFGGGAAWSWHGTRMGQQLSATSTRAAVTQVSARP